jgi:DNA sulfur modification protein DndB
MKEPAPVEYLGPLSEAPQLAREAVKRRKAFDTCTVDEAAVESSAAEGWIKDKPVGRRLRLKRPKPVLEKLENRFWMLLFKLGYHELNSGHSFTILLQPKGGQATRRGVSVFARDEETVIVAACRASEKVAKKSLQKELEDFASIKGLIAQSIHRHYGAGFKPKIIWFFVTENVLWSKPDKQKAADEKIQVVTERELRYYSQIAEHLGKAARYQFLAEFLKDQEIPELKGKTVPAIRGKLGGKRFYSFVTRPRDLLKISFVNHRSLNDPEGAPTYQRLVSKTRLRDISKFLRTGGFFPTNILINFVRGVRFDQTSRDEGADVVFGTLYLPDRYRSAWIIDGQHRLYGFSPIEDAFLDNNIVVIAFEKLAKREEAQMFVTINHEQRSVPKHLLDDLEGDLKWGSQVPTERIGATASRLINYLNTDVGYPFYHRIPQQGIPSTSKTCLTIPALKDAIRRSGLIGRVMVDGRVYEKGPLSGNTDVETLERARSALTTYFEHVRQANLSQWEKGRDGVLCTNVAVQAYIMLLAAIIEYWKVNTAANPNEMEAEEIISELEEYLRSVLDFLASASDDKMKASFTVPFGSGGPPEYFFRLCKLVKSQFADFAPGGMDTWEAEQSQENISTADRQIKEIYTETQRHLFDVLRKQYGDEYMQKGVPDKKMRTAAYEKSLDDEGSGLPLETYFDFIDFKKIIENRLNWPALKDVFNIPEIGEKGLAKNVKWLERINELRRISAHPSRERGYKLADFEYIDYIHRTLMERLAAWVWTPPTNVEPE